ncbi:MAG: hypothetical protein AB7D57_10020 [Desulfovibrionaceae bacterium]
MSGDRDLPDVSAPEGVRIGPSLALGLILAPRDCRWLEAWIRRHAAPFDVLLIIYDGDDVPGTVVDLARAAAPQGPGGLQILPHPLAGDFAAQRNYLARFNPCDWLLMLDADERLDEASLRALRPALDELSRIRPEVRVFGLPRRNTLDGAPTGVWPDRQFRLVRRGVRWRNTCPAPDASPGCHEFPLEVDDDPAAVAYLDAVVIEHPKTARRQARQNAFYEGLGQGSEQIPAQDPEQEAK